MSPAVCKISSCSKPIAQRGWCSMHYSRWRRTGTPHVASRVETFWTKINRTVKPPCWIWEGYHDVSRGYPRIGNTWAHRLSYELLVGPIPDGLTIDHLCFTPSCVNPSHLEPVSLAENMRRAAVERRIRNPSCPHGHEFTEENTYVSQRGGRMCRACHRARERERYRSGKKAARRA